MDPTALVEFAVGCKTAIGIILCCAELGYAPTNKAAERHQMDSEAGSHYVFLSGATNFVALIDAEANWCSVNWPRYDIIGISYPVFLLSGYGTQSSNQKGGQAELRLEKMDSFHKGSKHSVMFRYPALPRETSIKILWPAYMDRRTSLETSAIAEAHYADFRTLITAIKVVEALPYVVAQLEDKRPVSSVYLGEGKVVRDLVLYDFLSCVRYFGTRVPVFPELTIDPRRINEPKTQQENDLARQKIRDWWEEKGNRLCREGGLEWNSLEPDRRLLRFVNLP